MDMNAQERLNNIDSFVEKNRKKKMTKAENESLEIKRLVDKIKELQT